MANKPASPGRPTTGRLRVTAHYTLPVEMITYVAEQAAIHETRSRGRMLEMMISAWRRENHAEAVGANR